MQLTGFTVLVVEDDVDNLELLVSHFELEGAVVVGAASLSTALSATLALDVDALVCDLELPDGDGCSLLRQLRNREGWHRLPAVAITGYSDASWRRMAHDCGFDHYALKPFKLEELTDWLVEVIDRQSGPVGMSCHVVAERAARAPRRR